MKFVLLSMVALVVGSQAVEANHLVMCQKFYECQNKEGQTLYPTAIGVHRKESVAYALAQSKKTIRKAAQDYGCVLSTVKPSTDAMGKTEECMRAPHDQ